METRMIGISEIRDFFHSLFSSNGIRNVYFDTLPPNNKFSYGVVVDTGNQMRDSIAYVRGSVNIFVYGKTIDKHMAELENKVISAIENSHDTKFTLNIGYTSSDYDASRNLHTTIIMVNILI